MNVKVEDIGPLKTAECEIGDLTIICGENNTGKTYVTYSIFGFLHQWREFIKHVLSNKLAPSLRKYTLDLSEKGTTKINIDTVLNSLGDYVFEASTVYAESIPSLLGFENNNTQSINFSVSLTDADINKIDLSREIKRVMKSKEREIIIFHKPEDSKLLEITNLIEEGAESFPFLAIDEIIIDFIIKHIFSPLFPDIFISSSERTGAAIFRKELDFARNRFLDHIGNGKTKAFDPFEVFEKTFESYALPVRVNVEFTRNLDELYKKESFIVKEHPAIFKQFQEIIGGDYIVKDDIVFFHPRNNKYIEANKKYLQINESSSTVRSLMDLGFYLKHAAEVGDIVMIDEPELNLHPANQRRIARLIARLVNIGIKVLKFRS